tara:strand:- start:945 stop:1166 length:222 start_codon:yes stop_codon:yes gene_type:complete
MIKGKHIAVLCNNQQDFIQHEKDSENTYTKVSRFNDARGCVFDEIEYSEKARENMIFSSLQNFTINRLRSKLQ